jgi:hypothetical protein
LIAWGRVIPAAAAFASCDSTVWRPARGWFATARAVAAGGIAGLVSPALLPAPTDFVLPAAASRPMPAPAEAPRLLASLLAAGGLGASTGERWR